MSLSDKQIGELLLAVDPSRVKKDNDGYSHVEIYDVRARMNQIFGFGGWSQEIEEMQLIVERETKLKSGRDGWYVVYRAKSRVTILATGAVYAEWAAGANSHPVLGSAHDLAMKTAESQATKRACVNLGDQFGLSLYKGGSMEPVVGETLDYTFADADNVDAWQAGFKIATTQAELAEIAASIKGSDISAADRNMLLAAYAEAEKRLSGA